jgi:serine/threonine protein kinase
MTVLEQNRVVHRDLKPQNILLTSSKDDPQPAEIVVKIGELGFIFYSVLLVFVFERKEKTRLAIGVSRLLVVSFS